MEQALFSCISRTTGFLTNSGDHYGHKSSAKECHPNQFNLTDAKHQREPIGASRLDRENSGVIPIGYF